MGFKSFKEDLKDVKMLENMAPFNDLEYEFQNSSQQPSHNISIQNLEVDG